MKVYKTKGAGREISYGEFDDLIIFESLKNQYELHMQSFEFDDLMDKLLVNYKLGNSKYVQILREWNECIGFEDCKGEASIITDLDELIYALSIVEVANTGMYNEVSESDRTLLLRYLETYKNEGVRIQKR